MARERAHSRTGAGPAVAIILCALLFAPWVAYGRTNDSPALYFLEGELVQTIDYCYSVNATRQGDGTATVNLVNLPTIHEYGYGQEILSEEVTGTPSESYRNQHDKYDSMDCPYVELVWQNAPQAVVGERTAQIRHTVTYRPYNTTAPFPVNAALFSANISRFLRPEAFVQADDPKIVSLAQEITAGSLCQMDAVVRIINWVQVNIAYGCPTSGELRSDAVGTLEDRIGNCVNFANLAVALLRAAGIPSIKCFGFVADRAESNTGHAWVAVLYPPNQWIEYESSFWMPTGGLVPNTFLMAQHITVNPIPLEVFGPSPCQFTELHQATWTTLSVPRKTQLVRVEALNGEFMCLPLVVESTGNPSLSLNWTSPPPDWKVACSMRTLNFSSTGVQTVMLTLSTPASGEIATTIFVELKTPAGVVLGEVTIEVGNPPTIESLLPTPGSFAAAKPKIQVNYSSTRGGGIDVSKVRAILDGSDITAFSMVNDWGLTYFLTAELQDGNHTMRVEVWDVEGNTRAEEWEFMVDATPPTIDVLSPAIGSVIDDRSPTIDVAVSDFGSGLEEGALVMKLDGSVVAASLEAGHILFSPAELSDGVHSVRIEMADRVGNLAVREWSFGVRAQLSSLTDVVIFAVAGACVVGCAVVLLRRRSAVRGEHLPPPPPPP